MLDVLTRHEFLKFKSLIVFLSGESLYYFIGLLTASAGATVMISGYDFYGPECFLCFQYNSTIVLVNFSKVIDDQHHTHLIVICIMYCFIKAWVYCFM